jgi:outer membrane receptor protein involved in Fe transport
MSQVPRHQGSFQLLYSSGRTLFSGGVRSYDAQFEDDLNEFLLPGFATVQVMVKRRLAHGFSALLAAENLLDRTFLVGFTPTPTTGNPRLLRVGVRWESGS